MPSQCNVSNITRFFRCAEQTVTIALKHQARFGKGQSADEAQQGQALPICQQAQNQNTLKLICRPITSTMISCHLHLALPAWEDQMEVRMCAYRCNSCIPEALPLPHRLGGWTAASHSPAEAPQSVPAPPAPGKQKHASITGVQMWHWRVQQGPSCHRRSDVCQNSPGGAV